MHKLKYLGDGKVGGYGIKYGNENKKDLDGEYFSKNTKTFLGIGDIVPAIYNHGLDPDLGRKFLGSGWVTKKIDDIGYWFETQLDMRNKYELLISKLIELNKMGLSTGIGNNEVKKAETGEILLWPVRELSFTPMPANPDSNAVGLKSLLLEEGLIKESNEDSRHFNDFYKLKYTKLKQEKDRLMEVLKC